MKKIIILVSIGLLYSSFAICDTRTDTLTFVFEGKKLSGFIDLPGDRKPTAIVIIVPGYGKTNFGGANWYYDSLRANFVRTGLACFEWDKAGCDKSEGVFDAEQPVENSAQEVLSAIHELKNRKVPGSEKIGLWGISRAGWICPLVIQQYPQIAFWISVSGTDDKENFGYLLESNFRIEGKSEPQIQLLVSEWMTGNDTFRKGGSFEEYQNATRNLRQDSFWIAVSGKPNTKNEYQQTQEKFIKEHHQFDEASGLMIYIPGFNKILMKIHCPVLAIFGEKDANVDWRKTRALYHETIGANRNSNLTIKTFPNSNHSMIKCKTGGLYEKIEKWQYCDGYLESMDLWLKKLKFIETKL